MNLLRGSFATIAGSLLISSAIAQTYYVEGSVSGPGGYQSTTSNPGYASLTDGSYVSGSAAQTTLGANSSALENSDQATMLVERTVTDWTVSGPTGTTSAVMNLSLTGTLSADQWYGHSSVGVAVEVTDNRTNAIAFDDGVTLEYEGVGNGLLNDGYVYDQGIDGNSGFSSFVSTAGENPAAEIQSLPTGLMFSTDPISWTSGDTYSVLMTLDTLADNASPYFSGPSDSALFSDPFSFDPVDVLDLPGGWTLNSPQSGIVNNAVTPEPAPFAALGLGLVGLLSRKRKR